jgi:hypothetical protein
MTVMRLLLVLACIAAAAGQAPEPLETKTDAIADPATSSRDDTHILGIVPNYATVNDPSM